MVTGRADVAPRHAEARRASNFGRSRAATMLDKGRPSSVSGSCPRIRVIAPETDSTTPSGDTSMMTDPALCTTDRSRASRPPANSNRRRSVRSRRHSRTTSSPNHCVAVPTISTRCQPEAALTRISMGAPTSLSPTVESDRSANSWSSGCTRSRPDRPLQSSNVRSNSRSAEWFPHTMFPVPSTMTMASGRFSKASAMAPRSSGDDRCVWCGRCLVRRRGDSARGSATPPTLRRPRSATVWGSPLRCPSFNVGRLGAPHGCHRVAVDRSVGARRRPSCSPVTSRAAHTSLR